MILSIIQNLYHLLFLQQIISTTNYFYNKLFLLEKFNAILPNPGATNEFHKFLIYLPVYMQTYRSTCKLAFYDIAIIYKETIIK